MSSRNLGKLESIHGVAPLTLQRVAIVAVLSFVFFLAMLVAFYVRQHLGYFLISTGFLVVYVLTMIGWIAMRRHEFRIHENGISHSKFESTWDEISSVEMVPKKGLRVTRSDGNSAIIVESFADFDSIVSAVRQRSGK